MVLCELQKKSYNKKLLSVKSDDFVVQLEYDRKDFFHLSPQPEYSKLTSHCIYESMIKNVPE